MTHYLVKFTDRQTGKVMYKTGHTKWRGVNVLKERFGRSEYDQFNIDLLEEKAISHTQWSVSKAAVIAHENAFRAVVPAKDPSFMIEDYFERPAGTMKISGVTELIFLTEGQSEDGLISVFKRFAKALCKTEEDLTQSIR